MFIPVVMMKVFTLLLLLVVVATVQSKQVILDIPTVEIAKGVLLPMGGLGTWLLNASAAQEAAALALKIGYTNEHGDTSIRTRAGSGPCR